MTNESNLQLDIIALTETWANGVYDDSTFHRNGFDLFRDDRCGTKGGGVMLYIASWLHPSKCSIKLNWIICNIIACTTEQQYVIICLSPS